jgi:hypothetical protein
MRRGVTLLTVAPLLIAFYFPGADPQPQQADLSSQAPIEELWRAPHDIAARDLFNGPWGAELAPDPGTTYRFVRSKTRGINPGMTVSDPQGREWSVKQAAHDRSPEGPIEVVLSRVLSAVGYHQPPVYFLPSFELSDTFGTRLEPGGRFRLKHPALKEGGAWNWKQNPFVGTRPYQGLLVILTMFNSSDLKNSNNTLYEHTVEPGRVERWYVVRDLGSALGTVARVRSIKGDPDRFAEVPFLIAAQGPYVQFENAGWYAGLVRDRITPADVRWAGELLAQLSEQQWHDAFRAGGFETAVAARFIHRLREKVAESLALTAE